MSLRSRTALALLIILSCARLTGAQQPTDSISTDPVSADSVSADSLSKGAQAQVGIPIEYVTLGKLIKAAYPDLPTKGLSFVFGTQGDHVFARITESVELSQASAAATSPALLHAEAVILPDQQLVRFSAAGTLTEADKNKELSDQITGNVTLPDVSGTATVLGLQTPNLISLSDAAQNGPSNPPDVATKFDPTRWTGILGPQMTSSLGDFQLKQTEKTGTETAKPGWIVNAAAQGKDGKVHAYRIRLEPFRGQVVEIEEQQ